MSDSLDDAELRDELSTIKNMMNELLARIDPPEESWLRVTAGYCQIAMARNIPQLLQSCARIIGVSTGKRVPQIVLANMLQIGLFTRLSLHQ